MAYYRQEIIEDLKKDVSQGRCIIDEDPDASKKTNLWIGENYLSATNNSYWLHNAEEYAYPKYYSSYGAMLSYNGKDFEVIPGASILKYTNNELAVEKVYCWSFNGITLRRMCHRGNMAVVLADALTDLTPSGPYYFYANKSKCKSLCPVYSILFTKVL